ncbi:50S ribosomal protein L4 [Candidatus Woesearchaeota archaeon]|nr:50S ribosomal protein L4 [Candidatus Woesearchaeota archaeon]
MKADIVTIEGKSAKKVDLPRQFSEEVRTDLITRAVLAIQNNKRQPYGAKPTAGMRASAEVSRRRRDYRGSYGIGISRVPRKVMSKSGTRMNWVGAFAPGTVKGRKAHPPKGSKIWDQKINKKERRKAIRSAIAATVLREYVQKRNHRISSIYPIIVEGKSESLEKTRDVAAMFGKLGLGDELKRSSVKTVRAGVGKTRGRKYKKRIGPLVVVSGECSLLRSARNIPGVDAVIVQNLNAELLAPGCAPGRLTVWTENAIEKMGKESLFMGK